MNERIQELMVELKKTVSTHRGNEVLIGYDEIEKFAELIVQECAKVNNQFIGRRIGEIDLDMVYKEHFGVEV